MRRHRRRNRVAAIASSRICGSVSRSTLLLVLLVLLSAARLLVREGLGLDLHFDEAQYVVWSFEPAFGYFSKPPMIAWAIALARGACGESDFCVRLPSTLALAAATWLVFATGRRLLDERAAFWAALLFLLAPLVAFLAWFITTDSLLLLAWAAALYALVRALQAQGRGALGWWLTTGAVAGLGLLSKYTMGIFALSALGFLAMSAPHRPLLRTRGPWLGALSAALVFAPNVAWNAAHRFATLGHTATISNLDQAQLGAAAAGRGIAFVASQAGVFGPVAMLAFIAALASLMRRRRVAAGAVRASPGADAAAAPAWAKPLLAWFALPFLLLITAQAVAARAHANWAAPTYVAASMLAAAWITGNAPAAARRWLAAVVVVNLAVMAIAYGYRPLVAALERPLARDPMQQLVGWSEVGRTLEAWLAVSDGRLLIDERRLMSRAMRYGGPRARDALTWNPSGVIENHYQLLRDVARVPGAAAGPFLFISERDRSAELRAAFDAVEPLGPLPVGGAGAPRQVLAWRLGALRTATATQR